MSHKYHSAGVTYEFGLYTHKPQLAWIGGGLLAGIHDRTMFRKKLRAAILKKQQERGNNFRAIVDHGYYAEDLREVIALREELDKPEVKSFKARALARHESFNRLTKHYGIMTKVFHHDRGCPNYEHPRHKACLFVICVTIQVELNLGLTTLLDPYTE